MRVEIQAGDQRWQMPVGSTGQWSRQILPRQRRFHNHYVQRSLQRRDHRRAVLRVKLSLTIYPTMANFTSPAAVCSSSQPTRAVRHARLNPDQNQSNRPGTGAVRPGRMVQPAMHQAGVRNNATAKRRLLAHSLVAAVMGMILCIPPSVIAQEVYFSISGRSTTHYLRRPDQPVRLLVSSGRRGAGIPGLLRLKYLTPGLGGFADVLQGQPSTVTTFQLYPFDSLYELDRRAITPSESAATALESVSAAAEDRFLNRWVPFFSARGVGPVSTDSSYGLRTDDGNDVNDFKLRITGPGAEDWRAYHP